MKTTVIVVLATCCALSAGAETIRVYADPDLPQLAPVLEELRAS